MSFFRKKATAVLVEKTWSTTWSGWRWTVLVHYYQECLFGLMGRHKMCEMVGPFNNKQEAKRKAKRLRRKYKLK